MALIVTDIVNEYGAYYLKSDQNMNRLRRLYLFGRETPKLAQHIRTNDTIFRMAQSTITDLTQAFQKTWTPKGDVEFPPHPLELYNIKVDIDIYPDDIEDTWLGFLASENQSRKEWPLIRYIMEYHLFQKISENMELKEYYKGVYTAPTAGTAGITGQSMNGLKYQLQNGAGINHITMPALDPATIYDQLEEFYENISEEYQNSEFIIALAPKWRRAFLKDKRSLGYYDITGPGQIDDTLDFSPARVIGLPSMIGTDDVWATPKGNFLHVTKKYQNAFSAKVEEYHRCVSILTDWWEVLGFGINQLVWTNVAAATP